MPIVNYLTVNGRIISQNTHSLETATKQWIIPDPQGSVSKLVNSSGEITDSFYWWSYGEQMAHTGSSDIPLVWLGTLGYYTDMSGLYARNREQDPVRTSWRQLDPVWPEQFAFAYAAARPLTLLDPSGKTSRAPGPPVNEFECARKIPTIPWYCQPFVGWLSGITEITVRNEYCKDCRALCENWCDDNREGFGVARCLMICAVRWANCASSDDFPPDF